MSSNRTSVGLVDTSVLVAVEKGRPLREAALPARSAISIVTVAELRAGVLAAPDIESRDRRIVTLEGVRGAAILPVEGRSHALGLRCARTLRRQGAESA